MSARPDSIAPEATAQQKPTHLLLARHDDWALCGASAFGANTTTDKALANCPACLVDSDAAAPLRAEGPPPADTDLCECRHDYDHHGERGCYVTGCNCERFVAAPPASRETRCDRCKYLARPCADMGLACYTAPRETPPYAQKCLTCSHQADLHDRYDTSCGEKSCRCNKFVKATSDRETTAATPTPAMPKCNLLKSEVSEVYQILKAHGFVVLASRTVAGFDTLASRVASLQAENAMLRESNEAMAVSLAMVRSENERLTRLLQQRDDNA